MKELNKEIEEIKTFFNENENKKAWKETIGGRSASRFLGRFRSDLMRLAPVDIPRYLKDDTNKLNGGDGIKENKEGSRFGIMICEKFFNDFPPNLVKWNNYRKALVYACMEMEASLTLHESEKEKGFKEKLKKGLSLWEVGI